LGVPGKEIENFPAAEVNSFHESGVYSLTGGGGAGGAWAAATPFSNAVRTMIPKQNLIF
jgi:hypothetical protein